jgi:hypothetical protein
MTDTIATALESAWTNFLQGVVDALPRVLAMLSIVLVGWLVAVAVSFLVRQALRLMKIDAFAQRTGAADLLRRMEMPPLDRVIGSLVFWVIWLGFLSSGLAALGLTGMEQMTASFVEFVPSLVAALVILVVGILAANFAWRATLLGAVNARMPAARLVSAAVRFLIISLAVAMALEQIAVAKTVVVTAFAIAFGAVMLGLSIAFGIGGGSIARRVLEKQFSEPEPEPPDTMSHI